jgi:hypothetical protein
MGRHRQSKAILHRTGPVKRIHLPASQLARIRLLRIRFWHDLANEHIERTGSAFEHGDASTNGAICLVRLMVSHGRQFLSA